MEADDGAYGRVRLWIWLFPPGSAGMNATVLPEVTTSRLVCGESSMDVIGPGKVMLVDRLFVRRSHHLQPSVLSIRLDIGCVDDILDNTILSSRHACVLSHPYDTLDSAIMGDGRAVFQKQLRLRVRPAQVEHAHFLLLASGKEVRSAWGQRDTSDDVVVWKRVEDHAAVRVPYLPGVGRSGSVRASRGLRTR